MTPLHRAVALEQVHGVAVKIAQHLYLDVACAAHQLLQVDFVVAKGRHRLAPANLDVPRQIRSAIDHPHAAAAAAPARLEHEGITDLGSPLPRLVDSARQRACCRHHGYAYRNREIACAEFVAEGAQHLGPRTNERNAGAGAGFGKFRVFRKEAVAGVDGFDLSFARDANDVFDIEVGGDRLLSPAYEIGFVRF